jgi:hypothetical protein
MVELGRINPIKAYQTTDGKKFTGEGALERAEDHQRWINNNKSTETINVPKKTNKVKKKGKKVKK